MSEEYSEQIFDYFLSESLEGPEPPDLTERILSALAEVDSVATEHHAGELEDAGLAEVKPMVAAELVEERPLAVATEQSVGSHVAGEGQDVVRHDPTVQAPPVQLESTNRGPESFTAEKLQIRLLAGLVVAMSACLAYVMIGMPGISGMLETPAKGDLVSKAGDESKGSSDVGMLNRSSEDLPLSNENKSDARDMASADPSSGLPSPGMDGGRTSIDLEDLPFARNGETKVVENRTVRSNGSSVEVEALDAVAVVSAVDSEFRKIWDSLGIEPTSSLDSSTRIRRISETLVGKAAKNPATEDELQGFIQSAIESPAFANHWASVIVADWLKRSALPVDDPVASRLRRYVSRSIRNGVSWNQVVEEVLGGEIVLDQKDPSKASPAGVLAGSWGGNGNHRFAARVGSQFLNSNLACSRCHDAKVTGADGDFGRLLASQPSYYRTLGLLQGIEATGNGYQSGRSVNDRQLLFGKRKQPELFFERLDGRMAAVKPALPGALELDLESKESPRTQFAKWIASSDLSDRSAVNNAWRLVFGRYLVPQVAGVDVVALESRGEVLDLLQQQFVAHDRDMAQLISWLVQSESFGLDSVAIDETRWASASDEELATMQLQEIAFASQQSLGRTAEARNVERSVRFVVELDTSKLERLRTLAQASPLADATKKAPVKKSEASSASYLLYGQLPTSAEKQYLNSIETNEGLDWNLRVQHVSLLSQFEVGNSKSLEAAKLLRDHYNGDEQKALRTLLWSVKNAASF